METSNVTRRISVSIVLDIEIDQSRPFDQLRSRTRDAFYEQSLPILGEKLQSKHQKEENMPYVNIKVAGKMDTKQKEELCRGVTDVIAKVANKPPGVGPDLHR